MTAALRLVPPYTPTAANVVKMARDPGLPHRWKFRADVRALLDAGVLDVVIDCTEAGYLDGRDRGALFTVTKWAKDARGSLTLRGINEETRKLFAETQLDTVLKIEEKQ